VSTAPGNVLELEIPPGNTGHLLVLLEISRWANGTREKASSPKN